MKNAFEKALDIPAGSIVSVTASPAKGMEATVELSEQLAERGYSVIPHLSARLTKSTAELKETVRRLEAAGVTKCFVVGGDADDPGEFFDAYALIQALDHMGHPFTELGVTGYPEGHPFIPEAKLVEALLNKQPYASYMATQMCFDVGKIVEWVRTRRASGVDLPLVIGIPGAIDSVKLMTIGARIGVGTSLKFLAKNRRTVSRLMRPGQYTPDDLLEGLIQLSDDPAMNIWGLHLFTFNQIEGTREWLEALSITN
jgi:methylenetetrahydrofolate reductase (NADPH)